MATKKQIKRKELIAVVDQFKKEMGMTSKSYESTESDIFKYYMNNTEALEGNTYIAFHCFVTLTDPDIVEVNFSGACENIDEKQYANRIKSLFSEKGIQSKVSYTVSKTIYRSVEV